MSLKAARVNAELSLKEAAERLGISPATLSNYENGRAEPGAIVFQEMCILYKVAAEEIRFHEELVKHARGKEGKERKKGKK